MTFKIDKRYKAIVALKAIIAYILIILFILGVLHHNDPWWFTGTIFVIFLIFCWPYFFHKPIVIEYGYISFDKEIGKEIGKDRYDIKLEDITAIEKSHKFYNKITLTTQSGDKYNLYPQDALLLEKTIMEEKQKRIAID